MPNLFSWVYNHHRADTKTSGNVAAYLSLAEPILAVAYPLNLKVFLRLFETSLHDVGTSSRVNYQSSQATEENVIRLSHLNDTALMVSQALTTNTRKRKDTSVLL